MVSLNGKKYLTITKISKIWNEPEKYDDNIEYSYSKKKLPFKRLHEHPLI